ncbi:MAG: DUF1707 domain-containing protein [bacterium]|jgi:hypothetical protein
MSDSQQVSPTALRAARERTIRALCAHFAQDHLDVADFEDRLDRAHRATALAELDALVADLPPLHAPDAAPATPHPPTPTTHQRERGLVFSLMANVARRGVWAPARRTVVFCCMGAVKLDFREIALPPGVTEVDVFCVMGSVEIIVTPDLAVDVSGIPIMGEIKGASRTAPPGPELPMLRVNALALMGAVEVSARLPGESKRDARRRIREERRRNSLPPSSP